MKTFFVFMWALLAIPGYAQERSAIYVWRTTDGFEKEAAFESASDEEGTVTLLVPATLKIERLDAPSRIQLEKVRSANSPEPRSFMAKSELKNPTFREWQEAPRDQRIAYAGEWIYQVLHANLASREMRESIATVGDMNLQSARFESVITLYVAKEMASDEAKELAPMKLSIPLALIAKEFGWINDATQAVDGFYFDSLKLSRRGENYELIGYLVNKSGEDASLASFHINFETEQGLVAVGVLPLFSIPQHQRKSFKVSIRDAPEGLGLQHMNITLDNKQ